MEGSVITWFAQHRLIRLERKHAAGRLGFTFLSSLYTVDELLLPFVYVITDLRAPKAASPRERR